MIKHLITFLHFSKPQPTKVLVTGASPTLRPKQSSWDLWERGQASKPTRRPRRRSHSSRHIQCGGSFKLSRFACSLCKEKAAKGERVACFNYPCRGCGMRAITGMRGERGFCRGCLRDIESGMLEIPAPPSWEGSCNNVSNTLAGLRAVREEAVSSTAREGIDATSSGLEESISSVRAVVGYPERETRTELLRERVRSGFKASRKWGELKFIKMCDNQGCGNLVVDGDDITIKTCSEDSLVLVSVNHDHHNRLVSMEPVMLTAAQVGSPTGYAHAFWPSPKLKARQMEAMEDEARDRDLPPSERPRLWMKRGADLPVLLNEAINTPISSPRIGLEIKAPHNTPKEHGLQWAAMSRAVDIPRGLVADDQISELEIPPLAHPHLYQESRLTNYWMDLLDHPSTPSRSCSSPTSLPIEQARSPLDYRYSFPESLEDSVFCQELVNTLSTNLDRSEKPRDSPPPTPTPSPTYPFGYPRSSMRRQRRESIDSEASSGLKFLPYGEYRDKLLCDSPPVPHPASPKPKPASPKPTTIPSPVSSCSPGSLMFESNYFSHIQHPHLHPSHSPSPAMTPYPSLESLATSSEFGFRPSVESRSDRRDLGVLEATIHPRGCTPPSRANSPGLERWSNDSVSLSDTTSRLGCLTGGRTFETRSTWTKRGGRSDKGRDSKYEKSTESKSSKRATNTPSGSSEFDNKNGSMLLKRGGGNQKFMRKTRDKLVEKVTGIWWDWREGRRIKKEFKFAGIGSEDVKGIDLGPFVFSYIRKERVRSKGKQKGKRRERRR